jgi:hypothetical protein
MRSALSVRYRCAVPREHQKQQQIKTGWRSLAMMVEENGRMAESEVLNKRGRRETRTRATPKLLFVNSRGVDGEGVSAGAL